MEAGLMKNSLATATTLMCLFALNCPAQLSLRPIVGIQLSARNCRHAIVLRANDELPK